LNTNRLSTLVDSYQLATKQAPPTGLILIHNQPRGAGPTGFRAWWAKPGKQFNRCACGWRPDLGEHYRVQRVGPVVRPR
jgi:hypothetical protein